MVLYWKNMYIVKKLKVFQGTCWDKQMPHCRKLKDWWLKAKVWSFFYGIGFPDDTLAVKKDRSIYSANHNTELGAGLAKTSMSKPINSLKDLRAQKKNFFWDSTDPIQFHMGTVSLIIYHMLIHTIFYHIKTYASKIGHLC